MIDEKKLAVTFVSNLDEIATDFISCFGLKYTAEISNLSEPLLRWIDFRLRYIDPKPRKVFLSKAFPKKMAEDSKDALVHVIQMIQNGEDINPFQGKGLLLHHDTGGKWRQQRTDLLWADWGIVHLHLSDKPIPPGQYFSERSEWLLFALAQESFIALIDIRRHNAENLFENSELIEIVAESWPELMDRYELKGVAAPSPTDSLTSEERALCRKSGVQSLLTIGEKVYMGPGMGLSTASTATRVTVIMDNVRRYAFELARLIGTADSEFQVDVQANKISEPEFKLCITPKGLAVYEAKLDKAWLLPKKSPGSEFNFLADLNNIVTPEWAIKQISSTTK